MSDVENLVIALRAMAPADDGPSVWRNGKDAHWEGPTGACWMFHRGCAMRKAADELERLADEIAGGGGVVHHVTQGVPDPSAASDLDRVATPAGEIRPAHIHYAGDSWGCGS